MKVKAWLACPTLFWRVFVFFFFLSLRVRGETTNSRFFYLTFLFSLCHANSGVMALTQRGRLPFPQPPAAPCPNLHQTCSARQINHSSLRGVFQVSILEFGVFVIADASFHRLLLHGRAILHSSKAQTLYLMCPFFIRSYNLETLDKAIR